MVERGRKGAVHSLGRSRADRGFCIVGMGGARNPTFLGDHPKSGDTWSPQNRPTETLRNRSFLADDRTVPQQISASPAYELA